MSTPVCISFGFVPWQIVRNVVMDSGATILMIIAGWNSRNFVRNWVFHLTKSKMVMGKGGFDADSTRHLLHMMCMRVRV